MVLALDNDSLRKALKPYPFDRKTPDVWESRCRVLGVSRADLHRPEGSEACCLVADPPRTERLGQWIQQHPTFEYQRLWVLLSVRDRFVANRNGVYLVLKQRGWFVFQLGTTPPPRVQGWVSRASRSDDRWTTDVTPIPCGHNGWAHLATVIDCNNREVIGYKFALCGRTKEAEGAVNAACLAVC